MLVIYKKEMHFYFNNMPGYIFIAFIFLITGLYTSSYNLTEGYGNFEYVLGSVGFIYIVIVPIITMRVLAEERRQKTDQLLLTAPITISKIILGKYLAMVTVLLVPILVICLYPLVLSMYGTIPLLVVYSSIIGFFFMGSALIAIGMFISSLTESQLIASVLSFGILLLAYMMNGILSIIKGTSFGSLIAFTVMVVLLAFFVYFMTKDFYIALIVGASCEIVLNLLYKTKPILFEKGLTIVLEKLAIYDHLHNFIYSGIFDLGAIIYYLSFIALFIFFTILSLGKRRWS